VTPHQLRHTLATQAINRGMSLEAIAALLGHKSMRMTMVYAKIANRTVADEYFSVSEKVEALYDQPRELPATAEGAEMRKLRAEMHRRMLGNGYCARPVGLDCHFESICESCTYFQTTIEFRPTLQRQRDDARPVRLQRSPRCRSRGGANGRTRTKRAVPMRLRPQGQALLRRTPRARRGRSRARISRPASARAARRLRHLDDGELRELFDDLFEIPELDLALTITLPQLLTPDLQRLFDAIKADDPDAGDEVIPRILDKLDTPVERTRLARVIINLRDTKRLDSLLAAAAIIDLASRSRILLHACLVHTAFIHTGRLRTPGGLRLAA
jgi:integrase-like protein